MIGRSPLTRRGALTAGVAAVTLAACSNESGTISDGEGDEASEEPTSAAKVTVTPADGATDATAATEISWTVEDGEFTGFELTDAQGNAVKGDMHPDGTTWVPSDPLEWDATYTASVSAEDDAGVPVTVSSTFTTISSPPDRVTIEDYLPGNDMVVGQAGVLAFRFEAGFEVPEDRRAAVERRLFVSSEPAQEGSWHWITGRALEYRPKEYWQPGTRVDVRLGIGGMDLGGRFGEYDVVRSFSTDTELRRLEADDSTKQLRAYQDGAIVQTIPISLGAREIDGHDARSYSGHMIIMSREEESTFVSELYDYETDVKWAMRLTFSGQFIHGAPWAADALGKENISHGCINVTDEMGEWLYNFVRWGDPVVVQNTGLGLPQGDGFTSWDLDWEQVKAGSYLASGD
ncbi:Ig-like domain-containing protein [Glycomyces halotolerans]